MRYLPTAVFILVFALSPSMSQSAYPDVTSAIDEFVSKVYPKGSHYFWVINDTTSNISDEIIIDINTELQVESEDTDAQPNRFLLLLVQGKLMGVQHIPLGAKVDCHIDEVKI